MAARLPFPAAHRSRGDSRLSTALFRYRLTPTWDLSAQPSRSWMHAWSDLADFEVISVMSSAEAAAAFKRRDDAFSPAKMVQN